MVKLRRTVSSPAKAVAPLLSGRKIARPAVTVLLPIPGGAMIGVGAPALVDMAENCAELLQLEVLGQLCMINAAGLPKFMLTKPVTPALWVPGSPVTVRRY